MTGELTDGCHSLLSRKIQIQVDFPTVWQSLEFDKISPLQAGLFELLYHLGSGVHHRAGSLRCNLTKNKTNKQNKYIMKRQAFQPSLFRKLTFHHVLRCTLQVVLGKWPGFSFSCHHFVVGGEEWWIILIKESCGGGEGEGLKSWLHFCFTFLIFCRTFYLDCKSQLHVFKHHPRILLFVLDS